MFVFFTPYTYFFLSLYFVTITFIFSISNLLFYWLFIEILILLFIGISYTVFLHSYTQLILYFLFQTLASFSILVFFLFSYKYLVYISLFINLGIFPFFSWYINVLYRFPSFLLFLASSFHKLPPLFIFYLIFDFNSATFVLLFCTMTVFISSIYILYINDLRYLLVVSSIGNNSFIILAVLTNSSILFNFFFILYTINVLLLFYSFHNISSHSLSLSLSSSVFIIYLFILLLNLGSFPPFPAFFSKFIIFFYCLSLYPSSVYLLVILIALNVIIIVSYTAIFFKYITNLFTNSSNLLVY